jgi:hypothetical protein
VCSEAHEMTGQTEIKKILHPAHIMYYLKPKNLFYIIRLSVVAEKFTVKDAEKY